MHATFAKTILAAVALLDVADTSAGANADESRRRVAEVDPSDGEEPLVGVEELGSWDGTEEQLPESTPVMLGTEQSCGDCSGQGERPYCSCAVLD